MKSRFKIVALSMTTLLLPHVSYSQECSTNQRYEVVNAIGHVRATLQQNAGVNECNTYLSSRSGKASIVVEQISYPYAKLTALCSTASTTHVPEQPEAPAFTFRSADSKTFEMMVTYRQFHTLMGSVRGTCDPSDAAIAQTDFKSLCQDLYIFHEMGHATNARSHSTSSEFRDINRNIANKCGLTAVAENIRAAFIPTHPTITTDQLLDFCEGRRNFTVSPSCPGGTGGFDGGSSGGFL